jgi:mono/diheme cytochrome c family protein
MIQRLPVRKSARPGALVLMLCLAVAGWALIHTKSGWVAPEEAKKLTNPVPPNDKSIAAGKAVYQDKCAKCHGDKGKGDGLEAHLYWVKPPDFTDAEMMNGITDGEAFWKISQGRWPMPGFEKQLTEEQRWQLVDYLRTLAPKPSSASQAEKPKAPPPN